MHGMGRHLNNVNTLTRFSIIFYIHGPLDLNTHVKNQRRIMLLSVLIVGHRLLFVFHRFFFFLITKNLDYMTSQPTWT